MTRAQFEEAARDAPDRWWMTGEAFIHVPEVMQVEGWDVYGHPGNLQLTEPQRVLMMWSDLVGQVSNGGFTQFIDNFHANLALGYALITQIDWPDMVERFDRAFREQAGDPENPVRRQHAWPTIDPRAMQRDPVIRLLARRDVGWRLWALPRAVASYKPFSDQILRGLYEEAVEQGEVAYRPELLGGATGDFDWDNVVTEAADAFDDWLYKDETKAASRVFIGDYIRRHQDALCRFTD